MISGLSAARALIGTQVEVTIVDQRNFHTFQPLLYEVATAGLESGDVAYPIRVIFGKADNVTFRMAEVTGVDWDRREVTLADAAPLPFDSLVVASGATARFFGIPGASDHSFPLYTLTDARRLRDHILRRLEDVDSHPEGAAARGALTFVVVGGGPEAGWRGGLDRCRPRRIALGAGSGRQSQASEGNQQKSRRAN